MYVYTYIWSWNRSGNIICLSKRKKKVVEMKGRKEQSSHFEPVPVLWNKLERIAELSRMDSSCSGTVGSSVGLVQLQDGHFPSSVQ